MYCLSLNYKRADIDIRKKFVFSAEDRTRLSQAFYSAGIYESIVLCTCNRTEVYFSSGNRSSTKKAAEIIAEHGKTELSELSPHLMTYYDDNAILHLFRVACGIESIVMGEDEILGQVKEAYYEAAKNDFCGFELNTVFQAAVTCAKKIKTETSLSNISVSTATLAANEAAKLGDHVNVMMIGSTGKIGSSVLKNLLSHKNISVIQTMRSSHSGMIYADKSVSKIIDYTERYNYINNVDCIISATSSPHYTITYRDMRKFRSDQRKMLLIDLAVPPDIDTDTEKLPGIHIIDIDHFKSLALHNNALKRSGAEEAEIIIEKEIDELRKKIIFHNFLPHLDDVKKSAESLSIEEIIYKLKSKLTSDQLDAVLEVLTNLNGDN